MTTVDTERDMMRRAAELAARGRFGASPNPLVGAVVLDPRGKVVGEGYHAAFGGPHAEVVALEQAGDHARGGTLFVTLEPCAHHGKTPPCVDAILRAGIRRVVVGMADPTPVAGGGAERLRAEGVVVAFDGDAETLRSLNRRWLKWARERLPWITLKAAVSLDGRIATRTGESQWITGPDARRRSLELREEHDAILVGVGTVLADDPRLTRRLGLNATGRWLRVVLDSRLRTPLESVVVREQPESTLLVHTSGAPRDARERLRDSGVATLEVQADPAGRVALLETLEGLAHREISSVLVEGGGTVHGSFVDLDLVDEVVLMVAPIVLGGSAPPAVGGIGADTLDRALKLRFVSMERHGDDLELVALRREESDVHGAG